MVTLRSGEKIFSLGRQHDNDPPQSQHNLNTEANESNNTTKTVSPNNNPQHFGGVLLAIISALTTGTIITGATNTQPRTPQPPRYQVPPGH